MTDQPKLPLRVITLNLETDEVENDRVIDHNNHSDRIWLSNHCFWAFRNGRGVQTAPVIPLDNDPPV